MIKRVNRSLSILGLLWVLLSVSKSFADDAIAPATENTLPSFQIEHSVVRTGILETTAQLVDIYQSECPDFDMVADQATIVKKLHRDAAK
jgi:hypothetical protein